MTVTIIGIGLIGGSIAIGLYESGFATEIIGVEASEKHAQKALDLGLVNRILPLDEAIAASDMVIVATPVNSLTTLLPIVLDKIRNQVVLEVGSTKMNVAEAVKSHPKRQNFIATHPMAGTEFSGPEAAIPKLFEGKVCVLCDVEQCSHGTKELVEKMYKNLKMRVIYMDSENHDVHTAYISHISHITSFALALTVLEKEKDEDAIFDLASTGFQSTVRLAKSNPDTWIPIFEQNRDNVLDVLDEHIHILSTMRSHLIKRRFTEFYEMIEKANDIRRILK
ncbi:MAG: prephenate dehydrogenase [Saprospiraceae bacterium]|nr:prephenate dehydrogenase [Saprospiraceae bacterium]